MGMFDGTMDFSDPNQLALLGAIGALGQASMPSRLPIPTGAILAQAAGAMGPAAAAGYKSRLEQAQTNLTNSQAAMSAASMNAVKRQLDLMGSMPGSESPTSPTPTNSPPPNIVGSQTSGATDAAGSGALGPNQTIIASTLAGLGHSPAQIAGALGWGTAESGKTDTNTAIVNNTGRDGQLGGSFGWQQWLASRRDELNYFAQKNGGSPTDPAIQARFFDDEMKTPGSGAGAAELCRRDYSRRGRDGHGSLWPRQGVHGKKSAKYCGV